MKFWFDLCHPPHVLFFAPLIKALKAEGQEVVITYRERYQVAALMSEHGLSGKRIGRDYGHRSTAKALGLLQRSAALALYAREIKPDVAVSQGSSYQVLAAKALKIPSVFMTDYEHIIWAVAKRWASHICLPELIPASVVKSKGIPIEKVHRYPGLKEEMYLADFEKEHDFAEKMGWDRNRIWVLVRPPEVRAHYHEHATQQLYEGSIQRLLKFPQVLIIMLPRDEGSRRKIEASPEFKAGQIVIPPKTISGTQLIAHCDVVIGGGGTMNREAAVLGVPVFSIFLGTAPAIDLALESMGRLVRIRRMADICKFPLKDKKANEFDSHFWKWQVKEDLLHFLLSLEKTEAST